MLALSLSDKFSCFGIFVFVFVNENHTVTVGKLWIGIFTVPTRTVSSV